MSKIKTLMEEIRLTKQKKVDDIKNIKYLRNKFKSSSLTVPYLKELQPKEAEKTKFDKNSVKKQLKLKFKLSWKDPGYSNKEFSKIPVMKPKLLNEWEIERALMPEKNYKKSKNNNCWRMCHQLNEFPKPPKLWNSEIFNKYLTKFEKKFNDYVLRPSKYNKQKEQILLDKIILDDKKPVFRINNTRQTCYFGLK